MIPKDRDWGTGKRRCCGGLCACPEQRRRFPVPQSRLSLSYAMPRNATPRGVLEVDWPFFGEICRALALRVAHEYQPEIVLGIAKAGVIPGVVVASILQCEFASMAVTRREEGAQPVLVSGPPATI